MADRSAGRDVRSWRSWSWLLIVWSVVAAIAAIVLLTRLGDTCNTMNGLGLSICQTGATIGSVLGALVLFAIWLIGFMLLAIGWIARRPARRLCPPYGHPVDEESRSCPTCGYDFIEARLPAAPPGVQRAIAAPLDATPQEVPLGPG
jgi:predicted small secreted protein